MRGARNERERGLSCLAGLRRDRRGAISVEYLVAFLPVMFLFGTVWQTAHVYAGQLITQRAASAACRAASVVLPDDPAYYDGEPIHSNTGSRKAQIIRAAEIVLSASPRMVDPTNVAVEVGERTVKTTVTSSYRCHRSFGILLCGIDGLRQMTATSTYPYHRASYTYR